jgi:hypothetical protein
MEASMPSVQAVKQYGARKTLLSPHLRAKTIGDTRKSNDASEHPVGSDWPALTPEGARMLAEDLKQNEEDIASNNYYTLEEMNQLLQIEQQRLSRIKPVPKDYARFLK